ncbi:MAG: hypothetical protein HQ568_03845 [Calditrichaeota bacterium]|nr:hypothetical protein [Calditrichota bacterium]
MIYREQDLVNQLTLFLTGSGFKVYHEVPNMGQSVDIVGVKGRWIMLIEAKLSDWGRAFSQCEAHELVADFISVGIAKPEASKKLINAANKEGIGVITCNPITGQCKWQNKPKWNRDVWKPQRRILMRNLQEKKNGS